MLLDPVLRRDAICVVDFARNPGCVEIVGASGIPANPITAERREGFEQMMLAFDASMTCLHSRFASKCNQ